jgi:hypothetical protein
MPWPSMTQSGPPASSLPREFNAFLFAPVGGDRDGMALSVLSALARRDVDPWQEAAELANMPADGARARLTSLIIPLGPDMGDDAAAIVTRLLALLPRSDAKIQPLATNSNAWAAAYLLAMIVVLVTQFTIASRQTPTRAADASTPALSAKLQQTTSLSPTVR